MLHVRNLTLGAWSVDAREDYSLEFRNITDIVRDGSSGTVFAYRRSLLPIKANRSRGRHANPEVRTPGGPESSAAEERACPAPGEQAFQRGRDTRCRHPRFSPRTPRLL